MEAVSFRGDIKLLVPGGAGLNRLAFSRASLATVVVNPSKQAKNNNKKNKKKTKKKAMLWDYCPSNIATIVLTHDEVL